MVYLYKNVEETNIHKLEFSLIKVLHQDSLIKGHQSSWLITNIPNILLL